ncbi:MAG: hypothetical protein E6G17_06160, partial [Actinobacteria bacterium]
MDNGRRSILRSAARIGVAAAAVGAFLAPAALQVQPASAAAVITADSCGYPTGTGVLATVFNESTIMR